MGKSRATKAFFGGDSGESKPLWKGEGERPNRREKKGTKGLMGKESHAIIILGIQYNNCIVDRKISGKKQRKGGTQERER